MAMMWPLLEPEVRSLLARFFEAVERHDLAAFLALFDGGEGFTVVENAERYDWQGFQEFATAFFTAVAEVRCTVEHCAVSALAPHIAVATGVFQGAGRMASGEPMAFRTAFTFVLRRTGDAWRIRHVHESALETTAPDTPGPGFA